MKNKRRIDVDGDVFYWTFKIRYPQDILRLTVMTEEKTHSRLICNFRYKDFRLFFSDHLQPDEHYDDELLKITGGNLTPWLVRQVVDHALKKGWKPLAKGQDFIISETEAKINVDDGTETIDEKANPKSKI